MPETVNIEITPEQAEKKALTVPDQARAIVIQDNDTLLRANDMLLNIKDIRKEVDAAFDPIIKKAHEAHKEAVAQKKRAEAPLIEAEGIIKPRIASYMQEQERIRQAEEERTREALRKQEEEDRLRQAELAEKEGNRELAEAIINEPVHIETPVIPSSTPKLNGTAIKKIWKFRIVNESLIPREYLKVDDVKIGGVVRALKNKASIPGIEVYSESSVAAGRR